MRIASSPSVPRRSSPRPGGLAARAVAVAAVVALTGCASTPEAKYGGVARYSPSHRAYVVTRGALGESPGAAEVPVLLLRDPLTQTKIRCREQLAVWLGPQARATDATVRSDYDSNRSLLIMLPFTTAFSVVLGGAAFLFGASLPFLAVGETPHLIADFPTARSVYKEGAAAFRAGRYHEARAAFEQVLFMDPPRAQSSYALWYLGLSYEQEREDALAVRALTAFVERATVANASAYQIAEERLARLGAPPPSCSTEPVPVVWPR